MQGQHDHVWRLMCNRETRLHSRVLGLELVEGDGDDVVCWGVSKATGGS